MVVEEPVKGPPKEKEKTVAWISGLPVMIGYFFWVAVIGNVAIEPGSKIYNLLIDYWYIAIIAVLIPPILYFLPFIRNRFVGSETRKRVAVVIFIILPIVIALILSIGTLTSRFQVPLIRSIFLISACLLPGSLYYLFVASRRYNLLNEYVTNIYKLGLSRRRREADSEEPERFRRRRIRTYLESFEAVYGRLPDGTVDRMMEETDPDPRAVGGSQEGPSPIDKIEWSNLISVETSLPIIGATVLITLGWFLILPPIVADAPEIVRTDWYNALFPVNPNPEQFAFLGAYFFSVQMLFRRYLRQDLSANAYVSVWLRILLAVVGIWVAQQIIHQGDKVVGYTVKENDLLVLGFVVGVFPQVLWQLIRSWATKIPGVQSGLPNMARKLPLSQLDGLSVWHEARLEEEDVENIPNMATVDLLGLILQTRFEPNRIIDWTDQAILYLHLGPDDAAKDGKTARQRLREHGIYTASGLIESYRKAGDNSDRSQFEAILPGAERSRIKSLVDTIQTNPNVALIQEWRGLPKWERTASV